MKKKIYVVSSTEKDVNNVEKHYPYNKAVAVLLGSAERWSDRFKRPKKMKKKKLQFQG